MLFMNYLNIEDIGSLANILYNQYLITFNNQ